MWEMRQVLASPYDPAPVTFYSWRDGWGSSSAADFLARFHPGWLRQNPRRPTPEDVIVVLLGRGWEPYAVDGATHFFRRQVNP